MWVYPEIWGWNPRPGNSWSSQDIAKAHNQRLSRTWFNATQQVLELKPILIEWMKMDWFPGYPTNYTLDLLLCIYTLNCMKLNCKRLVIG